MNSGIIEQLGILAKYYKKTGDRWRQQAYQRAVISIKSYPEQITNIDQAKGLAGIGKTILGKIKEYLDTGEIRKVKEVESLLKVESKKGTKESTLDIFSGVWGIGPAKANLLWNAGIRSLNELWKNTELLTTQQRISLKYYKELLKPVPRKYIDILKMAIKVVLSKEFGINSFKMQIAGSYRRGEQSSGDIDCLITSKVFNLPKMIEVLTRWKIVTDVLSMRDEKFMGIVQCPSGDWFHVRMDVEFINDDEWGSGLLYFTGSKGLNIAMRGKARKAGLLLNQHGLFKGSKRLPVYTEKEIFEAIGMKFIPPNRR